jgi:hypothetical protein
MADEVEVEQPELEAQPEVIEPAVEPEPKQKFRKVIQPTDKDGKPIGSPHVYEADSPEELIDKIAEGVANGTRKINELSRQVATESPSLPEGAELAEDPPVWKPRPLTEEEKFIVKTDPEKAFDIQHQARYGMTVEEKAKRDQEIYENSQIRRMQDETQMFIDAHPEWVFIDANKQTVVQYFERYASLGKPLKWTKKNLEIAYRELATKGLLVTKTEEPEPVIPAPPRTEVVPAKRETSFPAAVRNRTTSATGAVPPKKGPSAKDIAMMSSEELKKVWPDELRNAR